MKKRRTIKEYFSDKTDKEIFAILLFFSCIILMAVLAVFRFCGIGYFANDYPEQTPIPWVQEAILAVEFFIRKTPHKVLADRLFIDEKSVTTRKKRMKAKGQTVPEYMQEMWDDEHAEYVEKVAKLKYKLETAKK